MGVGGEEDVACLDPELAPAMPSPSRSSALASLAPLVAAPDDACSWCAIVAVFTYMRLPSIVSPQWVEIPTKDGCLGMRYERQDV